MSRKFARGPKRRVERIVSRIRDPTASSTVESVILHAAEDAKTLIRTIIRMWVLPVGATVGLHTIDMVLALRPVGAVVGAPSLAVILDTPEAKQVIWRDTLSFDMRSDIGVVVPIPVHVDVKSMRKMVETDEMVLSYIASTAGMFALDANIVQFFKE